MKIVIQRVKSASVTIKSNTKETKNSSNRSITRGLMILLGIGKEDNREIIAKSAEKISKMRIFEDEEGKMNRSVLDIGGEVLIVSQFTLYADTKKGNRPGFSEAAPPQTAIPLYKQFISEMEAVLNKKVATGEFGADMDVTLINDGPVTIIVDTAESWSK